MVIEFSTLLDTLPDRVWQEVNRPVLLQYVAHPLITFEPIDPLAFPEQWKEQEYHVKMRLFGVIPLGWQIIAIERPLSIGEARLLRDNGRSKHARQWDHLITVEPVGSHQTRYTDRIEIEAGALTPLVRAFARAFYAHRQRRWQMLVAQNFQYHKFLP